MVYDVGHAAPEAHRDHRDFGAPDGSCRGSGSVECTPLRGFSDVDHDNTLLSGALVRGLRTRSRPREPTQGFAILCLGGVELQDARPFQLRRTPWTRPGCDPLPLLFSLSV